MEYLKARKNEDLLMKKERVKRLRNRKHIQPPRQKTDAIISTITNTEEEDERKIIYHRVEN